MLAWLERRRRNKERELFRFWDGFRHRQIDPIVVWHTMWSDPDCSPERDFEAATGITASGAVVPYDREAEQRVLALISRMFGVYPYSENNNAGLTVSEMFNLLHDYLRYLADLKKKRELLQTQSQLSAQQQSMAGSTTKRTLEFTCSQSGSTNDEPVLSSTPSPPV